MSKYCIGKIIKYAHVWHGSNDTNPKVSFSDFSLAGSEVEPLLL